MIFCTKDFDQRSLLSIAQAAAKSTPLNKTDFIQATGRRLQYVDIEFNDYIKFSGNVSSSVLPIGKIVEQVRKSKLPRPIGIAIELPANQHALFKGQELTKSTLYLEKEISAEDEVEIRVERTWIGLIIAILEALTYTTFLIVLPIYNLVSALRPKVHVTEAIREAPATLAESQLSYENISKPSFSTKVQSLAPFALLATILLSRIVDTGDWIPDFMDSSWIFLSFAPLVVCTPLAWWIKRKKETPDEAKKRLEQINKVWPVMALILILFISLISLFTFRTYPALFGSLSEGVFRTVLFSILGISALGIGIVIYIKSKNNYAPVESDSFEHRAIHELAAKANVKVRSIQINKELKGVNAAARFGGGIFFSEDFVTKLSENEKRAILAHEIGHLKGQHVPLLMLAGTILIALVAILLTPVYSLSSTWVEPWKSIIRSPIPIVFLHFFILLIFMPYLRKKAEFYADRFALQQINDYSSVACALAKVHLLNGAPHSFSKSDEKLSSHPSLTKRIDSLRRTANQLGMPIDETELKRLFGEEG